MSTTSAATTNDDTSPAASGPLAETVEEDTELQEEKEVFDALFSTRRPKDGWAGLSSGLKSVAKGTVAGAVSLVAQPVAGAQQDGVKGFFTGLATGVASCVALPVTGICVGAYQVGRGLANSGEAVQNTRKGMLWNEEQREWIYYVLDQEYTEVLELEQQRPNSSGGGGSGPSDRNVKDMEYYNMLKVSNNATPGELKKAYYKEARTCHPDKNPDDPEAAAKFQALGHAYAVLSDEQSRAYYDQHGKSESNEMNLTLSDIDPRVFFAVMFGSEAVRPYIGELWIANKADSLMKEQAAMAAEQTTAEEGEDASMTDEKYFEKMKSRMQEDTLKQRKREIECARNLRERISPFVDGSQDDAEFIALCQEEAARITKGSFGDVFCIAIGTSLEVEADIFLGAFQSFMGLEGQAARWKKRGMNFNNQMKVLGAGLSAARAGSQAYKEVDKLQKEAKQGSRGLEDASKLGEDDMKAATEKIEASLPAFLDLAWAINTQDISRTLKSVCHKLFHDSAEMLPLEVRLKRAQGVKILGREFSSMGKVAKKTQVKTVDASEIRTRAEVAAMRTMAKAQGQEVSDEDTEALIKQAREMERMRKMQAQQAEAKASTAAATGTTPAP